MTSKLDNGYIYTQCTRDTKYGYHDPRAVTQAGSVATPDRQHTAKKSYTPQCAEANEGTRLPCGHVVSSGKKQASDQTGYNQNGLSKSVNYNEAQRNAYPQQGAFPSGTQGLKKTKCQCPLYTYKRYDKMDPVKAEPPHYPQNLKTIYTKDYTPKEADNNRMNFSPVRTAQKSYPTKDNYNTIQRVDYTPKKARSTTPIKQPEHKYTADVPFQDKTEYKDMTKSAFDHTEYQPVKRQVEPYQVKHGFPEKTEYEQEYTPKRAPKTDPRLNEEIYKGTPQRNAAPLEDKTIYKGDYTPKRVDGNRVQVLRAHDANPMPRAKLFDGLTIYKKDYLSPELYQCECPEYEAAQFAEHTHHGQTVPVQNAPSGHHHIHEVPVSEHRQHKIIEHTHEDGPTYRYEKIEKKSPLRSGIQEPLPHNAKNDASGRYFDKIVDRSSGRPTTSYVERTSGPAKGSVTDRKPKHGDHLHYIETMCEEHGGNHKHYIETICPDHHHIHTVDA